MNPNTAFARRFRTGLSRRRPAGDSLQRSDVSVARCGSAGRGAERSGFRPKPSLLPQRRQVGVPPGVGMELIVDVPLQLFAGAGEARLELRVAAEELQPNGSVVLSGAD